jgi:hypothetical protein
MKFHFILSTGTAYYFLYFIDYIKSSAKTFGIKSTVSSIFCKHSISYFLSSFLGVFFSKMSAGFTLSEIEIVIPQEPKPEVPMFEQTMSLLLMIKEQKVILDIL